MSRKAVITGAGGAIGGELALRLDHQGYSLVLVDVSEAGLAATASALSRPPVLVRADLADPRQLEALAASIGAAHADLSLLANVAGYIEPGDVADLEPGILGYHIKVNLLAPMQLSRAAAQVMRSRGRGDILSVVSMGGIIAMKGSAAYAASKFGLRGFQTSLRSELVGSGVRVLGVFPSGVDTPMLRHEATHGGTAINFLGKPLTAQQVADACIKALDTGRLETYLPYSDSVTTRFFATWPWLIDRVLPFFERRGERGRAKFLAERGLIVQSSQSVDR